MSQIRPPRPRPPALRLAGIPTDPPGRRPGRHRKNSALIRMALAAVLALFTVVTLIALSGTTQAYASNHNLLPAPGKECAVADLGKVAEIGGKAYVCEQRGNGDCPRWHRHHPPCRDHCKPCAPSCSPSASPSVSPSPTPSVSESPAPSPTPSVSESPTPSPADTPPPVFVPPASSGLPLTGTPVGWLFAVSGLLIAAGAALWLLGRRSRWVHA